MRLLVQGIIYLNRIIGFCLFLLIIATLVPLAKPYISNYNSYTVLAKTSQIEQSVRLPLKRAVGKFIPTVVYGYDLSRLYLIVLILILMAILGRVNARLNGYLQYRKALQELETARAKSSDEESMRELNEKVDQLKHAKPKTRKELIRDIIILKSQLTEMEKTIAFLSIDVIGSTKMKEREDKLAVQFDFDRYNEIVVQLLEDNNCIKFASTPDGIMAAFVKLESAVIAGKKILSELQVFNDTEKRMNQEMAVRIGINSGKVIFDESEPLEQLSDRVVDIAGHMQKYANRNSIFLSRSSYDDLALDKDDFTLIDQEVDDERVYMWKL